MRELRPATELQSPPTPVSSSTGRSRAACERCRASKVRCCGTRPNCSRCGRARSVCVYVTEPDESRGEAAKRKRNEHDESQANYAELVQLLKTRPLNEAQQVFFRIRSGEDIGHIVRHVRHGDLLLQMRTSPENRFRYSFSDLMDPPPLFIDPDNPYTKSPIFQPSITNLQDAEPERTPRSRLKFQHIYEIPYQGVSLIDSRLDSIDASFWTSVTSDNALVAKLVSLYLLTDYCCYGSFNKDLFLDDLVACRKTFCSQLLVNAICAAGMHAYRENTKRAEWWSIDHLGYAFMAEAKRLYDCEAGRYRLTTLQAAVIISVQLMTNGQDKVAMANERQIGARITNMQLYTRPLSRVKSTKMQLARATTAWCVFSWQTMVYYYTMQRPFFTEIPSIPLPSYEDASKMFGEFALEYSGILAATPRNLACHRLALIKLRMIQHQLLLAQHPSEATSRSLSFEETAAFHEKLEAWCTELPECLQPDKVAFPGDIGLHGAYLHTVITLFQPWAANPGFPRNDMAQYVNPKQIIMTAQARLETLIRLYYLRHNFQMHDILLTAHLLFIGSIAGRSLAANPSSRSETFSLILCANGLYEQSLSDYIPRLFFQGLVDSVGQNHELVHREFDRIRVQFEGMAIEPGHVPTWWPVYRWIDPHHEKLGE